MNRKITLSIIFIITILLIFCSVILSKDYLYSSLLITDLQYQQIIDNKKIDKNLKITEIKFNGYYLIKDNNDTYYYSLIENNKNKYNPYISFKQTKNSNVKIVNSITDELISNNDDIIMIIYNEESYNQIKIKCTTLPIISINYDDNIDIFNIENIDLINNDSNYDLYNYSDELLINKSASSFTSSIFDNSSSTNNRVENINGKIKLRGNSSLIYDKKSFSLTLYKNEKKDKKSLIGLNKTSDYFLYSLYNDEEKIRNVFSLNLWNDYFAFYNDLNIKTGVSIKYVELILNGEYYGLYALGNRITNNSLGFKNNNILFKKNTWELSIENNAFTLDDLNINNEENAGFELKNDLSYDSWMILLNYYEKLNSNDYNSIIKTNDIKNSINFYLFMNLIQATDNIKDNSFKNTYILFVNDNNSYKAYYIPWDLDMTFGNVWGDFCPNLTCSYKIKSNTNLISDTLPIIKLYQLNNLIGNEIKKRYDNLRQDVLSDNNIINIIDNYENQIYNSGAFIRDKEKWPDGSYNNIKEGLNKFKEYVLKRLIYMDQYIKSL